MPRVLYVWEKCTTFIVASFFLNHTYVVCVWSTKWYWYSLVWASKVLHKWLLLLLLKTNNNNGIYTDILYELKRKNDDDAQRAAYTNRPTKHQQTNKQNTSHTPLTHSEHSLFIYHLAIDLIIIKKIKSNNLKKNKMQCPLCDHHHLCVYLWATKIQHAQHSIHIPHMCLHETTAKILQELVSWHMQYAYIGALLWCWCFFFIIQCLSSHLSVYTCCSHIYISHANGPGHH